MELDNNHGECWRVGARGFASALLLLCVIAIRGRAQAPPPSRRALFTLELAIATALRANADLLTARLRVDSARAERHIAGAWPNPTLSATPSNPSQYALQIPLDIWPARGLREKTTAQGVSAAHFDVSNTQRQVVFAVRQAFYDILLADSLRTLANDQAETFRRLLAADSVRLRNGSIAERDVVTTRLQLVHAMAVVARSSVQQHAARLALENLVGATAADTSVLIDGGLAYRGRDVSADSILALALVNRPDYIASSVRVAQSASALSLAKATLVPVPVVGGVYQPAEPFRSGSHVAPSLGLAIPILNVFSGERARAASSLAAARVAATRTRLQIQSDVALAFDSYRSARELADRYECGLLADAAGALDAARYAYERGATGLPDLLEAIRVYADTRSDYLTAVHDYWVSLFALEQAAGTDFEGATP